MFTPTLLMMRSPPTAVPTPMLSAQNTMSHTGSTIVPSVPMPAARATAKMKMDHELLPVLGAVHEGDARAGRLSARRGRTDWRAVGRRV